LSPAYLPVILGAVLIVGLILAVRWLRDRAFHEVLTFVGRDNAVLIDSAANCLGVSSRGASQIRGNGCLCLTPRAVVFQRWIPKERIEIPRTQIRDVDDPTSHLGKSKGVRLLRIHFDDASGRADSIAFAVRELSTWLAAFSARPDRWPGPTGVS